jgi:hypothetical protein
MTAIRRLARLEKQAAAPPANAGGSGTEWAGGVLVRPTDEARELARATVEAFAEMVGQYTEHFKLSAQEAVARAEENTPDTIDRILQAAPDQVSRFDLHTIGRQDPEAAHRQWGEIKDAARGELRTGELGANAVNCYQSTCWKHARFQAVRSELIDSLGPRNAAELLLIYQLTTFQTQLWEWQTVLTNYAAVATLGSQDTIRERGVPNPPRMTDAEAMEQAAAMVERFQRMFHRSLAAFHAQRRQAPVVVRRAGQVNMALNQQFNMAS